jgi:glyoxylase-like metal-dependent hydrolase (beta-lactamase superfamily II)
MSRVVKRLADGIHTWAVYSQEKQLDFNGLHLQVGDERLLVDPVPFDADEIDALGAPSLIVLTNKDHRRAAVEARARFGAPVWIHRRDQPLVGCEVDGVFDDGDVIAGALEVVPVHDAKSPGESALWWRERRILILGDALIGKPAGKLSLLPPDKFADPIKARAGAQALVELAPDMVLVGDGVSILEHGTAALRTFATS